MTALSIRNFQAHREWSLLSKSLVGKRTSGDQMLYYNVLVSLYGPVLLTMLPKGKVLTSYSPPIALDHSDFSAFIN